ncbi:MAG: hypothetical protein OHK0044_04820 [Burkholderiaceae bacterium]
MSEEQRAADPADGSPIVDRSDASGFAGRWLPLAALAIISLLLVRACIEAAPPPAQRPAGQTAAPAQPIAPR